jgi:gliding motility-associated-like protein
VKQKKIFQVAAIFAVLLLPALAEAKHIIGGDITYVCLGETSPGVKRWRFTMHIYRDCLGGGANFDNPAAFAIYQGTEDNNSLYTNFSVAYDLFTPLEPDTPQCVTNIPYVCVQEATYTFEEDLPVLTNESYFIVYQRCCRNESITNLISPGDVGATYTIELTPAAMAANNNSPIYLNFPPIIICNNLPLVFNHSATDADGDFLVYTFCDALLGGGSPFSPSGSNCDQVAPNPPCGPPFQAVPYTVPTYNAANPMGGNPQVSINPVTGQITGIPLLTGQFVVAVCVQEYRNGLLLSTVRREFQFNVTDCTPDIEAKLSSDSLTILQQDYTIKSCGDKTIFFQNKTTVASNVKDVEWRFDINGTTVSDNVNKWFTAFTFPDTGTYHGMLLINQNSGGCSDTAFIHVQIFPEIHAKFTYDYDTCVAGPVAFIDQSKGDGGINQWKWNFGIPGASGATEQNPVYKYPEPGNHPVKLNIVDKNQCADDTTGVIQWFPAPPVIIIQPNTYFGCAPSTIYFNNLSDIIDENYHIVWYFGDGDTLMNVISPNHLYKEPGVYDVRVEITSPIGCYIFADFPKLITVEAPPVANFSCDPDSGLTNFNNRVQFIDQSTGAQHWNWQIGPDFTTLEQNPTFTFLDTGSLRVRLIVTHPAGCKDSMTKELDFMPIVTWYMPNAFTPNGDGTNDDFYGKGFLYGATNFKMTIWNRWGEMVYETSNPADKWNGEKRNSGGMSPEGVYIYTVSFKGPRGELNEYKGFATLVR